MKISDQTKRFWGVKFLSYLMALISLFFERKLYRMHLKINGEHIRGRIMTVCIGSAWGYGQAPSAVPYNGWLDVSVIYRPELLQLVSGLWMLIQGRILNHKVSDALPYPESKSTTCTKCFGGLGRTYSRPAFSTGHRNYA